jgi:hypothetical protein
MAQRFGLLLVVLAMLAVPAALARAEERPPIVVELFTSQGCNSCPPADAYLGELARRPGILAFAFHVDYWNYIGWTDPFGRPWSSTRQRGYQKSLNERFVYTPQIVVNGAAQGIGSERDTIEGLLRAATAVPPRPHPELTLHRRPDGALIVDVGAGQSPPQAPADIWLIGFDRMHNTQVLRGENEGQTLTDYHPVRAYRRIGAWPGWALELVVPASETEALGDEVAVLVQTAGLGPILTASVLTERP